MKHPLAGRFANGYDRAHDLSGMRFSTLLRVTTFGTFLEKFRHRTPSSCRVGEIVDVIAQGREPNGLSLERLTKRVPVKWEEQRGGLGF